MEWTRETPTEAGVYWLWERGHGVRLVTLFKVGRKNPTMHAEGFNLGGVVARTVWWQGPIEKPRPPKGE